MDVFEIVKKMKFRTWIMIFVPIAVITWFLTYSACLSLFGEQACNHPGIF